MTLLQIVDKLSTIALSQPNVRSASEGNVYDYMDSNPSLKYGVFFITQNSHIEYEDSERYGLTLFYIDRLEDDMESNRLRIQSHGKQVLSNILTMFCNQFDIDFPEVTYTSFTQKFVDECAGCYANILIEIYKDTTCEDGESPVWEKIGVLQNKDVTVTENGNINIAPDAGYDGIKSVRLTVDVVDTTCFERGYNSGHTDGMAAQKALLSSTEITENGEYTSENGFSAVTVSVHPNTTDLTVSVNGEYTPSSGFIGYSAVTVNVNSGECAMQELNIVITTDNDEPITGVQFTVSYAGTADTYTYNGEVQTIAIYPGVQYLITFGEYSHYITPDSILGVSKWNVTNEIGVVYKWQSECYVNPESVSLLNTGGTVEIEIVADGAWTASTTSNWFTLSPATGTGDGTVTVTANENETGYELEGAVNISFYDDTTGTTQVYQSPTVYLNVEDEYILFEHSGSSYHIAVSSNTEYDITTPEWITYEYEDNLLKLTASDIGNTEGRHGKVTFTYGDNFEKSIDVNQVHPDYTMFVTSSDTFNTVYMSGGTLDNETEFSNVDGQVYIGSNCTVVAAMCGFYNHMVLKVLAWDIPSTSCVVGECCFHSAEIGLLIIPENISFYQQTGSIFTWSHIGELRYNSSTYPGGSISLTGNSTTKENYFVGHSFFNWGVDKFILGPNCRSMGNIAFVSADGRIYIGYPRSNVYIYAKSFTYSQGSYTGRTKWKPEYDGTFLTTFVNTADIHIRTDCTTYFPNNIYRTYWVPEQIRDLEYNQYINERFV